MLALGFLFFFNGTDGFSSCQGRHLGSFVPSFFFFFNCRPYTRSIYCVSGVVDIKEQLWLLGFFCNKCDTESHPRKSAVGVKAK